MLVIYSTFMTRSGILGDISVHSFVDLGINNYLVAVMAVHALSKLGETAVPPLLEAYTGAVPRGRIHIMRALAELRDPRSIRLMMDSLEEDSAALQYWAQEGLERLGLNMVYLKPD